jgi:hypothetical protein
MGNIFQVKIDCIMNSTVTKIFFLLIFISTAFATVELISPGLVASPEGDYVVLKWSTGSEEGLIDFVIERSTPGSPWIEIETIPPQGNNSNYSYVDKTAYKANDLAFIYKLKIRAKDVKDHYSNEATAYPKLSGVKRTWGSIKAMFR